MHWQHHLYFSTFVIFILFIIAPLVFCKDKKQQLKLAVVLFVGILFLSVVLFLPIREFYCQDWGKILLGIAITALLGFLLCLMRKTWRSLILVLVSFGVGYFFPKLVDIVVRYFFSELDNDFIDDFIDDFILFSLIVLILALIPITFRILVSFILFPKQRILPLIVLVAVNLIFIFFYVEYIQIKKLFDEEWNLWGWLFIIILGLVVFYHFLKKLARWNSKEQKLKLFIEAFGIAASIATLWFIYHQIEAGAMARNWEIIKDSKSANIGQVKALEYLASKGIDLSYIDLSSTTATQVPLQDLSFSPSNIGIIRIPREKKSPNKDSEDSGLYRVILRHAIFSNTDLSNADFSGTDLSNADFSSANLTNVKFYGANLEGVVGEKLKNVFLTEETSDTERFIGANLPLSASSAVLLKGNYTGAYFSKISDTSEFIQKDLETEFLLVSEEVKNILNSLQFIFPAAIIFECDEEGVEKARKRILLERLTGEKKSEELKRIMFRELIELTEKDECSIASKHNKENIKYYYRKYPEDNLGREASLKECFCFEDLREKNFEGITLARANLKRADLKGADFYKVDLSEANLEGADLTNANLTATTLTKADLSGADLSGADLRGANLRRTNLRRANLDGVDLFGADLSDANLSEATLTKTYLIGADLIGADLSGADLSGADLRGADLTNANLTGANIQGANLNGAILSRVNLTGLDLTAMNLRRADLSGANLNRVNLDEVDLFRADLSDANLTEATLTKTYLSGANLSGADLTEANLGKADLRGADLSGSNLSRANLDEVDLFRTDLSDANLTEAVLTKTYLIGADLSGADLSGADLSGADLRGADLTNANLTRASIQGANLNGAILSRANLAEQTLLRQISERQTLGEQTLAVRI